VTARSVPALRALLRERGLEVVMLATPAVSLVASVLIARSVGPSGRGHLVTLATWGQVLAWVSGLSIDKALIASRTSSPGTDPAPLVRSGVTVMLLAGGLGAAASVAVGASLFDHWYLLALIPAVVLGTVLVDARAATLLVADRWRPYVLLRGAQPVVYLAGCAVAFAVPGLGDATRVGVFALALVASVWLPALALGGAAGPRLRRPDRVHVRALAGFGAKYHAGLVLHFLNSRIDLLAMPLLFSAAQVGVYAVATSAGQIVALLGSASLIRGLAGRTVRGRRVDRAGRVLAVAVAAGSGGLSTWLIPLFFGEAFAGAVRPAQLLCVGGVLMYVLQGLNGKLAGDGSPQATILVNAVGTVSFMILLVFARTIDGVAVANVVSTALALACAWWLSRRVADAGAVRAGVA
jgi:O-antigen/teichoic acid export membrane protein